MKGTTATNDAKKQEIEKFTEELKQGIAEMRGSEGYKKMLDTMSTFPTYSFTNLIMIFRQNPEATRVCGFNAWKKLGRHVKKGEHGIRIWAPLKYKVEDEETGEQKMVVKGFRLVSVFDISQTDGAPLSTEASIVHDLEGNVENFGTLMDAVKSVAAYPVTYGELKEDCKGVCKHNEHIIVLQEGMSELQQLAVLIHETAHSLLHGPNCSKSRDVKELEAESVAYIVCKHFGLNTEASTFGYVASWTSDMKDDEITTQINTLQAEAVKIINAIDGALGAEETEAA